MEALLLMIEPGLKITSVSECGLNVPAEDGNTEAERALRKALYYFSLVHAPVLSEDDGIYFDGDLPVDVGINIANSYQEAGGSPFDFWNNLLKTHNVISGILKKSYALVTNKSSDTRLATIPFTVATLTGCESIEENVMNHFIIPLGSTSAIAAMSVAERQNFRMRYLAEPVSALLQSAGAL